MQQETKNQNRTPYQPKVHSAHNLITLHAMAMALGTMFSRILGLLRELAFAALFEKTITDAWITAFRLPNLFRRLLGEGALSVSFVPVFVESRVQDSTQKRSYDLVHGFYTLLFILLSTITVLGILFPEKILDFLLDPQYSSVPGKMDLTIKMARIMFVFIFFISHFAFYMAILNALGYYALAAFAPTFFNMAMIISTFLPVKLLNWPGQALAWGVVVGGALQALILVPALIRLNFLPKIIFQPRVHLEGASSHGNEIYRKKIGFLYFFRNSDLKKVLFNMGPGLIGMGLLQITTLVNLRYASELSEGSISYINYADRLLELPLSLISVSLGTVLLPSLSKMWAEGAKKKMIDTGNYYLRLNLYVSLPAALGLYFLSIPIIEILFQRGLFNAQDTLLTAGVVKIYSFTMIASSCVRVLVPHFYAIKNTWLPALVSGISLVIHIFLAPILMERWKLYGLNASTSITSALNLILLLLFYSAFIGKFDFYLLFKKSFLFIVAGFGLILGIHIYFPLLNYFSSFDFPSWIFFLLKVFSLALALSFGMALYFLVSSFLKLEEFQEISQSLQRKLKGNEH